MAKDAARPWAFELDEYVREGEPGRAAKAGAWATAIGLQDVDGLKPSQYLIDTARRHIEGDLDIEQVQSRIGSYYLHRDERSAEELQSEEADIVSARIAKVLGQGGFHFSPAEWQSIHAQLFDGLIKHAGSYRTYNISKPEWVLNGDTVRYAGWESIVDTVEYDFERERRFDYGGLSKQRVVAHIASFAAGIWQIHPFPEGNTRSTAVFVIKYLESLGMRVGNDAFANNSWYFRNALVRANYNDMEAGVHATPVYLERFFENVLLGARHELKNRYVHIDWVGEEGANRGTDRDPALGAAGVSSEGRVATPQVAPQVTPQVAKLLSVLGDEELSLREIAEGLGLSDRKNVMKNFVGPAIDAGVVERTVPDKPNSRLQKYRRSGK